MKFLENCDTFKKSLEKDNLIEDIRSEILNRKTYEFLETKALITLTEKGTKEIPEASI